METERVVQRQKGRQSDRGGETEMKKVEGETERRDIEIHKQRLRERYRDRGIGK